MNNIKHKLSFQLFIGLLIFSCFFIFLNTGARYNIVVLSIFFLLAIFSLYGIFISIDSKSFSLNKSFCIFYYFFFSLAPVVQYKNKTSFFISEPLTESIYINTGLLLLGVLILYVIGYHFLYKYLLAKTEAHVGDLEIEKGKELPLINIPRLYVFVVLAVVFFLYLIKFDWSLLIYRPYLFKLKNNTNLGLVGYAILLIVRLIPFVILLYYKIQNKINNKHTYFFLLMVLLICFPTALSRGILAIIYIPIFILFLPPLRKGVNYVLLFIVGLLVIFPLFNNFRYLKEGVVKFNYELFNSGHFDAFQNFALLINENIITNGRQLLGSILFFVQEGQWINRPHGTGHLLGETVGYSYLNVSMPFFGEGYANWGYLGIIVFLIFLIILNSVFDVMYARIKLKRWIYSLYLILLGFEFYLMRGDLMSSIKIISSFIMALLIAEIFILMSQRSGVKT